MARFNFIKTVQYAFKIEFLLMLWLVSLPFGSKLFAYSFKGFTIYPTLLLSLIICAFSIKTFKKWNKFIWIYTSFLMFWLFYAVFFMFKSKVTPEAIFDIRSLIMQLLYFLVFVNSFYLLNKQSLFSILKNGVRIYFYLLLLFGLAEFFTGNHVQGTSTDKLVNLPISNMFNAPLFLYDNTNDYLLYALFFLVLNLFFDQDLRNNFFHKLTLYIILLVFAIYAESVLSKYLLLIAIIAEIALKIYKERKSLIPIANTRNGAYLLAFVFLILVIVQSPIFLGPKYKNSESYRINGLKIISKEKNTFKIADLKDTLSLAEQKQLIEVMDSLERNNPEASTNERKNLILNGIDFIKEKTLLGIGPGNYKIRHNEKKVRHFTHTINSAHNFPIEIISQYGLIAWIYFLFVGWFLYKFIVLRLKSKNKENDWMLILICILPVFWIIPSAYLYLDLHWILVPMLFIAYFSSNLQTSTKKNG